MYVIAGSRGMAGAAVLSAWGAARGGAGLVRLAIVESLHKVAASRAPLEVTIDSLPEDGGGRISGAGLAELLRGIQRFQPHVIALGPGLGRTLVIRRIVSALVFDQDRPVVLDADGLNALSEIRPQNARAPLIMTPHPGEMARLLGTTPRWVQAHRRDAAASAARKWKAVCLLKGAGTVVTDARRTWVNTTGNPGMASGGMGDVLTGVVAALWAQQPVRDVESGFRAAAAAAYLHGLAADIAVRTRPAGSLLASDVVEAIPAGLRKIRAGSK